MEQSLISHAAAKRMDASPFGYDDANSYQHALNSATRYPESLPKERVRQLVGSNNAASHPIVPGTPHQRSYGLLR
jgi:hypothetical protein